MKSLKEESRNNTQNILLISYHFPPGIAVGGNRISNFAKYLPQLGWNTFVLTVKEKYLEKIDKEKLKEVPNATIYRTSVVPKLTVHIYLHLKKLIKIGNSRVSSNGGEQEIAQLQPSANKSQSESFKNRLKRYLFSFMTLPDAERSWMLPAVLRGVGEVKKNNIRYILTSCPPYSVNLIGLFVKLLTNVKWITDFRDPWMTAGSKKLYATCELSLKIERWLERRVIKKADLVLTTTDRLCNKFTEAYAHEHSHKFVFLTNGFDADLFKRFDQVQKYNKFTLSYTGSLYFGRSPEPVFQALRNLAIEDKIDLQKITLKLVGHCRYVDGYPTANLIKKYKLNDVVELIDSVPYFEALKIIKKSHIALLFAPDQPYQIPAKVYDYIGLGINILTLAGRGATADLVNSNGAGKSFLPAEVNGIQNYIYDLYCGNSLGSVQIQSKIVKKFDRKKLTEKLVRQLANLD